MHLVRYLNKKTQVGMWGVDLGGVRRCCGGMNIIKIQCMKVSKINILY